MCAPMLGAVVGMLSAVANFAAAQSDYEAKATAWKANYTNSLAAGRDEHTQLQLRQLQEAEKHNQEVTLINQEEAQKRAEATVQASAQGVSGISVDNLLGDITRKASYNREVSNRNYFMVAQQLNEEQKGVLAREESNINSMERPVAPNPLTLVVGILGAGVKAFDGGGSQFSFAGA